MKRGARGKQDELIYQIVASTSDRPRKMGTKKGVPFEADFVVPFEDEYKLDKDSFRHGGQSFMQELVSIIIKVVKKLPPEQRSVFDKERKSVLFANCLNRMNPLQPYSMQPGEDDIIHLNQDIAETIVSEEATKIFHAVRPEIKKLKRDAQNRKKKHTTKTPDERYIDIIVTVVQGEAKNSKKACDKLFGNGTEALRIYNAFKDWCHFNGYSLKKPSELKKALNKLRLLFPNHTHRRV